MMQLRDRVSIQHLPKQVKAQRENLCAFLGVLPKDEIYNKYSPNSTRKMHTRGKHAFGGKNGRISCPAISFLRRDQGIEQLGEIDKIVEIELFVDGMNLVSCRWQRSQSVGRSH